jgi:hypothetical protein
MLNFRQFEAGPDPFGRKWLVLFKWMQTAIAIRHSDTVDARFILRSGAEEIEKTVALPHSPLLEIAQRAGRPVTDPWCSRLAALHISRMVATGEDMDKDLVTVSPERLAGYAEELEKPVTR